MIRVALHLIATDKGGRRKPVFSGLRPNWTLVPNLADQRGAQITLKDRESVEPGDDALAELDPLIPHAFWSAIQNGDTLYAWEGTRLIATATVLPSPAFIDGLIDALGLDGDFANRFDQEPH